MLSLIAGAAPDMIGVVLVLAGLALAGWLLLIAMRLDLRGTDGIAGTVGYWPFALTAVLALAGVALIWWA